MKQNTTVLETRKLQIGYSQKGKHLIIGDGIDIQLQKGQLITLVGANGIGKSTLLRTITAIQKPLQGEVLLHNRNLRDFNTPQLAQEMSIVLTEQLPPSNLSVYELVALGRQPYTNWLGKLSDWDVQKVQEALQLTQIEHLAAKKHYEISDGQLQNVLIARALAQDTPLIILDEPTTHLDLLHKAALFRLLKKLAAEAGKCILFSTHDIELAIQMSDSMIIMHDGKAIQGTPQECIADGSFDRIFKEGNISFDPLRGIFVIA